MTISWEVVDDWRIRIPQGEGMRVPGIVFAGARLREALQEDQALAQVANVAHLPGILRASFAMPDIHWGYGFPIGGVAAMDPDEGVVSPGGIGFDINCGVRLLRTDLEVGQVRAVLARLVDALFCSIPTGVGSHRSDLTLSAREEKRVSEQGARWAIRNGYGEEEDLAFIEEHGTIPGAQPDLLSDRVLERGKKQLGTLGSGNHFVEVGYVDEIFDPASAGAFGLFPGQVTVIVHTGSRGFGYQICDESTKGLVRASAKYGIRLPDRQLCSAPLHSPEGRSYLAQMACGANYAFSNRQVITHFVRESFQRVFRRGPADLGIRVVYDVCHNIGKFEKHVVEGSERTIFVHRKGATRAFPPGHPLVPEPYREAGQPVLIPGDMGRCSYVLAGTRGAFEETWGSTCHGAGRLLSRTEASRRARPRNIPQELEDRGILVRAEGRRTIDEEMPDAYKDVGDVVDTCHGAGISRKVARLRPVGVIKG